MESKKTDELDNYEILIAKKYALDARKKLGSGSTGVVYLGKELKTKNLVAIKLEYKDHYPSLLKNEFKIYKELQGVENIPKIHFFGDQGNFFILIMDLLGPSLKDHMNFIKKPFSLSTTLKISIQLLNIIKNIHKKGVLLRYIKPENMAIGRGDNEKYVYLIDFGLSKRYIKHGMHSQYKKGKRRKGNIYFISINAHFGVKISRRDDIESLGYNLVYFMKGKFPWSNLSSKEVREKKLKTSLDELCQGLPEEFKEFINYARKLQFTEEPDYNYLNSLLLKAAQNNKIDINTVKYDWVIYKENLQKEKNVESNEIESKEKEVNKEEMQVKEAENKKTENTKKDEEGKISENVENGKVQISEDIEKEQNKTNGKIENEKAEVEINKISECVENENEKGKAQINEDITNINIEKSETIHEV